MNTPPRLPYAASLDGLRAVAVGLVVAYHLDVGWARGGFLGVDLFFVISGFLITTLLLREDEQTGRIELGSFWLRRFRRLVPPLVAMVAATVIATRLWGIPEQRTSIRSDSISALGYVANWRFVIADQSYFDSLLGPSPLRHTWSLAVEEQWYFVWPLVMVGLCAAARGRRRTWVVPGIALLAVCSAVLMAVLHDPVDASRVYFGTDTRAQQLLVGALLAWVAHRRPALADPMRLRRAAVPVNAALAAFVIAAATVPDEATWLYRGGLLALSCIAAIAVLGASVPGTDGPLRWLAAPPLVAIGRRSYGLYLWHWPVIVFVGPPMGLELDRVPLAVLQIVLTLALTEASYRIVEMPVRTTTRRPLVIVGGWTGAGLATAVAAVLVLVAPAGRIPFQATVIRPDIDLDAAIGDTVAPSTIAPSPVAPSPVAGETVPADTAPDDATPGDTAPDDTAPDDTAPDDPAQPAAGVPAEEQELLLLGDSTALVLAYGLPDPLPVDWDVEAYARVGCGITAGLTIDVGADRPTIRTPGCDDWSTEWALYSKLIEPDLAVVMVGAWEVLDYVVDDERISFPGDRWTAHLTAGIEDAVAAVQVNGGQVALLRLPCMEQSATSVISTNARNDPARVDAFNDVIEAVAASSPGVITLPLDELLCPGGEPLRSVDGNEIRYDGVHLTAFGAGLVWDWLLDEAARVVESSPASGSGA